MKTLPLSDVKARLSEVIDDVDRTHEQVTVTRNGRPAVVLLAIADYESMQATLETLSDPAAVREIAEARASRDSGGALYDEDDIGAVLAHRHSREDDAEPSIDAEIAPERARIALATRPEA